MRTRLGIMKIYKTRQGALRAALALGVALLGNTAWAQAATPVAQALETMQQRVSDGQFDAAYALAKSLPEAQGDAHFDFLFGVAAINVGRTAEGVLALERHLAQVPGNDRARLDLARGYFELGDYVRARQEFEFVLRYNPPAEVRANIQRYLDAMQTRETLSNRANAHAYLEAGYGADSNANVGTYNDTINTPSASGTLVDASSRSVASSYSWVAGGAKWVRQVSAPFAVFGGGDFDDKLNQDAPQFNVADLSAYAGFSLVSGEILYRFTLADANMLVNNIQYRSSPSGTGELQYAVGNGLSLNASLQYAESYYSPDNDYRDATMETLGLGLQQSFHSAWRPSLGLQLSGAREDNLNKRPDLSRELDTWRISASVSPTDQLGISVAYTQQLSAYQSADLVFLTVRSDQLDTLDLVVSYALSRAWLLRADLEASENQSNQGLYAYRRTLGALKLRYSF